MQYLSSIGIACNTSSHKHTHSITPKFSFWQPYFFLILGWICCFILYVLYVVISLLNWFSGNWQLKLYLAMVQTFRTKFIQKVYSILAFVDSYIYQNKWLLLHLAKRGKSNKQQNCSFAFCPSYDSDRAICSAMSTRSKSAMNISLWTRVLVRLWKI